MWVRQWLQEEGHCVPCVLTLATDEVERICYKNGLLFHELLSAFSTSENAVPFRSSTHTHQLQNFRVRFVKATEMAPRPMDAADKALYESFAMASDDDGSWLSTEGAVVEVAEKGDVGEALAKAARPNVFPWSFRFKTALARSLQYVEPELLECPAAVLLVVATTNEEPMQCFEELSLTHHWPHVFQTGQFNPQDVAKVYVLVHDDTDTRASLQQAGDVLRQMKISFPTAPCKLLRINSLPPAAPNLGQADIWRGKLPVPFFAETVSSARRYQPVAAIRGCCLSSDDLLTLREFTVELTNKVVIPAMEKRIFTLQQSVTQARKGMKNFVKSFWRKPREQDEPRGGHSVLYRYDRIESQIRLLADTCFVMQDYESALASYRLVRDDYRQDKAWLHLGSVFEMIAVCLYLTDQPDGRNRRDTESSITEAIAAYGRRAEEEAPTALSPGGGKGSGGSAATLATRMATRLAIMGSEVLVGGQPVQKSVDAATMLINAARKETPLCSAVLIEQAAWCFLRGNNIRKFAFYVSMAGQMFLGCQQEKHAVRCYLSSLAMYERGNWRYISDHVHYTLARQLLKLSRQELSLYHLLRLVASGRQSQETQQRLMTDLLNICREHPQAVLAIVPYLGDDVLRRAKHIISQVASKPAATIDPPALAIPDLVVPKVLEDTLAVTHDEVESDGSLRRELQVELRAAAVLGEKGGSIREWEEVMTREEAEHEMLRTSSSSTSVQWRGRHEPIAVSVDLSNPLSIPVQLDGVQLTAVLEGAAEGETDQPPLEFETVTGKLEAQERRRISLRIVPRRCGLLRITGLKWRLFGQVWTSYTFVAPGPLLQDTLEHRAARARGPNTRLTSRIVPELPSIDVSLEDLPDTLFQGEIAQAYLRVTNRGLAAAGHVFVKISPPGWVFVREPPPSEDDACDASAVNMSMAGVTGTVFRVVPESLPPGKSVRVPVCIRGQGGGKQTLRLLLRYEREGDGAGVGGSGTGGRGEQFRYVEVLRDVCVLPSVAIQESVAPSYSQSGECVLSLNISNYRTDADATAREVTVHQVVAVSRVWRLEPIGCGGLGPQGCVMGWQERLTLHYRLVPAGREGEPLIYEHDLSTDNLASGLSSPSYLNSDQPLPPATATTPTTHMPYSLDFLYVEHANHVHRVAREERKRAAGSQRGEAPKTLGEIKRLEAEKRNQQAAGRVELKSPRVGIGLGGQPAGDGPATGTRRHPLGVMCPRGKSTVSILVTWSLQERAPDAISSPRVRRRVGQHQVLNYPVRPLALDPNTAAPLTLTVDYPPVLRGRLSAGGLLRSCQTDVLVTVHNRMTDICVDFIFEALAVPSGKRQSANKAAASPCFIWLGPTTRHISKLQAGASVRLPVRACFLRPGVYDLNRFRFVVHMPANAPQLLPGSISRLKVTNGMLRVPYIFSSQYLIRVEVEKEDVLGALHADVVATRVVEGDGDMVTLMERGEEVMEGRGVHGQELVVETQPAAQEEPVPMPPHPYGENATMSALQREVSRRVSEAASPSPGPFDLQDLATFTNEEPPVGSRESSLQQGRRVVAVEAVREERGEEAEVEQDVAGDIGGEAQEVDGSAMLFAQHQQTQIAKDAALRLERDELSVTYGGEGPGEEMEGFGQEGDGDAQHGHV